MSVFGRVLDGLSGLAGIFINYIYAGCGNKSVVLVSTPVYRKFEKPVPTRQPVKLSAVSLCLFEDVFSCWFYICLHLHIFVKKRTYVLTQMHLCFSLNALAF